MIIDIALGIVLAVAILVAFLAVIYWIGSLSADTGPLVLAAFVAIILFAAIYAAGTYLR